MGCEIGWGVGSVGYESQCRLGPGLVQQWQCVLVGSLRVSGLQEEGPWLTVHVSSGWRTICFHVVPTVRRRPRGCALAGDRLMPGFPEGSVRRISAQEESLLPTSAEHWR